MKSKQNKPEKTDKKQQKTSIIYKWLINWEEMFLIWM